MDKYEVMLYPRAYRDIDDIYAYIALEKLAPENAKASIRCNCSISRKKYLAIKY